MGARLNGTKKLPPVGGRTWAETGSRSSTTTLIYIHLIIIPFIHLLAPLPITISIAEAAAVVIDPSIKRLLLGTRLLFATVDD